MSLRPIDMTIPVQRSPEVNRSQSGESARPEVAHQQFADKLERDVRQQERQVNQPNKSEDGRITPDGRGNSGYAGGQKKQRKHEKDAKPKGVTGHSTSLFDVSI